MARIRCAIYTRKSTEEGLDQDFNSLDAQREACEAYIKSQAHEGWRLDPTRYDDGGFSGGNMERPALQRLMEAIRARQVDRIIVYKIDRLTRSLADFAKLVEDLDAVDASFVSVTQSFSTATSMGRLTLNMLLSFAQFEREVTAERIRDKIAASKAKGLWMGGRIPTGYDADGRKLKVNEAEAQTIRRLFRLYLELGQVPKVVEEAKREGLLTKRYQAKTGRMLGGRPFTRGLIYRVLNNAIYIGRIPHKDTSYPGQHQAIIDQAAWDQVQAKLATANRTKGGRNVPGALSGRLFDADGIAMTRHTANPRGKVYTYYLTGEASSQDWRIRAADIEGCLFWAARQMIARLKAGDVDGLTSPSQIKGFEAEKAELQKRSRAKTLDLVEAIFLRKADIEVRLAQASVEDALGCELQSATSLRSRFDIELTKRKHELKLVYDAAITHPDLTLQQALLKAIHWKARLTAGETMTDIARADGLSVQVTTRRMRLAMLSPTIQMAIAKGTQPVSLTLQRIIESHLPLYWNAQDSLLLEQGN
ncbi:recombinase family protein [uncultured Erythrobacter sp.]|uniref:recombinase family protein n=1 Tax=uncultured Erythrobacter sp. TaxID=263913 RepID=UPI002628A0A7|nr:recombinase family protein [uncultured Erythrobacter sp.]